MQNRFIKIASQTVWLSYLSLAILTPLIFTTANSELFEVPKMHFVYFFATIILFETILKFILDSKIPIPSRWKLATIFAFLTFLAFQTLSTITSIDRFTSIFGYPTRLNGGLLSLFAYFVIFVGAIVNLNKEQAKKLLLAMVLSAVAVSLWGIPAHFGRDPSCLVLTGRLNASCWQKEFDPTQRIFSTLGQPNWLASFLVLVIPISLALVLSAKKTSYKICLGGASALLFIAALLTNSRAGLAGLVVSLIIFALLSFVNVSKKNRLILSAVFFIFVLAAAVFSKPLVQRIRDSITYQNRQEAANRGTESTKIRLIVWRGALDAFRSKPLLGFGPETFAYSYYKFRPDAHNQTTEWNFFYNKAHNEFINYLTNTGVLGLISYLILLSALSYSLLKNNNDKDAQMISKATFAGLVGYQVTIFFGFSTVAPQLFMFIAGASALAINGSSSRQIEWKIPQTPKKTLAVSVAIIGLAALSLPLRLYFADTLYARAKSSTASLTLYPQAISTFVVKNPFYLSEYAYELALNAQDGNSKDIAQRATATIEKAQSLAPNNIVIQKRAVSSYTLLSSLNPTYKDKAVNAGQKLVFLAKNDPQSYIALAKVYIAADETQKAKEAVETALAYKKDYVEALELLDQINKSIIDSKSK